MTFFQPSSTFITALGYDPSSQTLRVYIGGKHYDYGNFNRYKWYRMRKSQSVGSFYSRLVRGNARHALPAMA